MNLSREKLLAETAATGFRPDTLEKVLRLLSLLMELKSHPFLKGKLALKGGTALNLFVFNVPRLSVDIDLNYIGPSGREAMLEQRPLVERAINAVCKREGLTVRYVPDEHAGGKWYLRYKSALVLIRVNMATYMDCQEWAYRLESYSRGIPRYAKIKPVYHQPIPGGETNPGDMRP